MREQSIWQRFETDDVIWASRSLEWTLAAIFAVTVPFRWVVWIIVGLYWAASVIVRQHRHNKNMLSRFNMVMIPIDVFLISVGIHITGGFASQAFLLYTLDLLFLAVYSSIFWAAWGTLGILLAYALASHGWNNPQFWWRELILGFLGITATALGLSMRQTIRALYNSSLPMEQIQALKSLQESVVKLSSLPAVVQTILQTGLQLLDIEAGYAAKWTTSGKLKLIAQIGLDVEGEWDPRESYELPALTSLDITYFKNLASHESVKVGHGLLSRGYRELVLVPLKDGDQIIGILAFAGVRKKTPLNDHRVILEGLADMVVNQIRFEGAQANSLKRGRLLAVLERVGRIVNRNLEMETLLRSLHQAVADELETDSFFVALTLPNDPGHILMQYLYDEGKEYPPEVLAIGPGTPTEQVLLRNEPLLLRDNMGTSQLTGSFRVPKSAIFSPLVYEGRIIGAMSVQSYRIDYDDDHMEFVSSVASQAAIAIQNAQLYQKTESIALTDYLTNLGNSRHFSLVLRSAVDYAVATNTALSLLLIDSDSLKQINDRYGHIAGDTHLQILANVIRRSIRDRDTACRYAGDEFVIILPETELNEALRVGERIRREMDGKFAWKDSMIGATISVGAAEFHPPMTAEELFAAADRAMYAAKRQGKNRVAAG
ncbi:diguanylate cyclase (GGDEF) domain-containing protein [Sulfobacillus thermosulfidooxidans DSM 9293]|uniref:Diguanylate cyclase (GGDEF) domain-containing protein n=1 Tax=Sulfobacillus thermosulfidooxidans (strain DSM 9293 / VKM B-1269 / AT-1) TaxID=929705 RepID=A0A1W1W692_SULTA|nr:diguanylate cyclase [Sulfobacillus thermosulfidooxidans]SMC01798.1 diguanylate cyclase (GGDEF) domain-containing protein [Sulfobacillus thermosulfidooxidans DSM 9293]